MDIATQAIDLLNNWIKKDKVLLIAKIEFWLLKYYHPYREIIMLKSIENGEECFKLPDEIKPKPEERFLDLYLEFEKLCSLHRFENYFEQELSHYREIVQSREELKKWLLKNEKYGEDILGSFNLDYLDYDKQVNHLNIFVPSSKKLEIFVKRSEFANTVKFLEIFEYLYWEKELHKN
ncbi:hypothetical protein MKO06_03840 [Gramella sp. GC03-9]|uniref:Uncharacterized protein n=1 Tax=Christiangramia oceanisediminis TaxID=2920386 RepID=A0A9X2I7Q3_9FLAO|nr:hypothetical protein [Gramella oceanisediminis]MCP9199026.1 hypothetical protein [Gramella oceanisediminis]